MKKLRNLFFNYGLCVFQQPYLTIINTSYCYKLNYYDDIYMQNKKVKTAHNLLFIIILLSTCQLSISQETERNIFSFKGSIIDESNGESIPFVTIFNESTRSWAIADEAGNYSLSVCVGDTLVFSSIGFLGAVYFVNNGSEKQKNTIQLTSQKYDIEEVKVFGYRNYSDFQKAFLKLELPESDTKKVREKLNIYGTMAAIEADYERRVNEVMSRPGIGFSLSSGRSLNADKILLEKLQREEAMQRAIDKKYNRKVVFELTQLPEDELTNFIGFCNFSIDYLYNASEYDILVKIMAKFALYKVAIDTCG
jgi:hypothetical protein